MIPRSRIPRVVLVLLTLWATAGVTACQKWATVGESPVTDAAPARDEEEILVVLRSDERIELSQPIEVLGDSLAGMSRHTRPTERAGPARRIVVPLDDIVEIKAKRDDALATSFLVVGAVAVALFGFSYIVASDPDY